MVERCFNRLKQFRGLSTRYAKRAAYYRAEIIIAATGLWLRTDLQDTAESLTATVAVTGEGTLTTCRAVHGVGIDSE